MNNVTTIQPKLYSWCPAQKATVIFYGYFQNTSWESAEKKATCKGNMRDLNAATAKYLVSCQVLTNESTSY